MAAKNKGPLVGIFAKHHLQYFYDLRNDRQFCFRENFKGVFQSYYICPSSYEYLRNDIATFDHKFFLY